VRSTHGREVVVQPVLGFATGDQEQRVYAIESRSHRRGVGIRRRLNGNRPGQARRRRHIAHDQTLRYSALRKPAGDATTNRAGSARDSDVARARHMISSPRIRKLSLPS
jgi:hypothetical protein